MKELAIALSVLSIVFMVLFVININSESNNMKVDYIDIGYSENFYDGKDKLSEKQLQALAQGYEQIRYNETTSEEIDYDTAVTISFISNDKIAGFIIVDDKGRFETKHILEEYEGNQRGVLPDDKFYKYALLMYKEIEGKY